MLIVSKHQVVPSKLNSVIPKRLGTILPPVQRPITYRYESLGTGESPVRFLVLVMLGSLVGMMILVVRALLILLR